MSALAILFGLLTATPSLAADSGPSLTTLAAATSRPAECAALVPRSGSKKPSVWRLARMPTLGTYCDDLARAQALIATDPKAALQAAQDADVALPDRASASVAIARAELALGDVKTSLVAFDRALSLDKRSLDEAKAMSDYARALVISGKAADAASHYRALVPRAELLPDAARPLVYLQAAHALMAHAATGDIGRHPESATSNDLADASAYLNEARTMQSSTMRGDVLLSLALIFDRAGDTEKASLALAEAARTGATITDEGKSYVGTPGDALALAALAIEAKTPSAAADAWTKFIDSSPPSAWANAAKVRVLLLKRSGGKSSGAQPRKQEPKRGAK